MLAWIHQFVASEREQFAQLLAPSNQLNSPRKTMRPLAEALPEDDLDLLHQVLHTASKPRIINIARFLLQNAKNRDVRCVL